MKKALVTGGNRGIGYALAKGLHEAGLAITIGARNADDGIKAAQEIGCASIVLDVADPTSISAAPADFDVLVNNAGVQWDHNIFEDNAKFDASLDVMVRGPQRLIAHMLPHMRSTGYGRIVNVSSDWGSFASGLSGGGAYGIAKAALNGLTVIADRDLPTGVKVNSMCPGWVHTRMGGDAATRTPEQGADTGIWLATLPEDGPTGGFFQDRKSIDW